MKLLGWEMGIESTFKRQFNNMQGYGWQSKSSNAMQGSLNGL